MTGPAAPTGSGAGDAERISHLLDLGRYELAAEAARRARAAAPGDSRVIVLAAWAQLGVGDVDGAITLAQDAALAAPHSDLPFAVLAEAHAQAERHEEAVYAAYRAVELDPADWRNHLRYARRLAELPDQRDRAWEAARQAVRMAPDEPEPHAQIAALALAEGETFSSEEHLALAELALHEALRRSPDDPHLLHDLARVRAARAGWAAGLDGFGRAVAADPGGTAGRAGRANIALLVRGELYRLGWALVCAAFVPVLELGRVAIAAVVLGALGYAVWTARRVRAAGEHAWPAVLAVSRRHPLTIAATMLLVGGFGGLVGAALAPGSARSAGAVAWLAGVGVVGVIAVSGFVRDQG